MTDNAREYYQVEIERLRAKLTVVEELWGEAVADYNEVALALIWALDELEYWAHNELSGTAMYEEAMTKIKERRDLLKKDTK